jgi:hypothetical protein
MVDVKNKRCETAGCGKQPSFNTEGNLVARFCATHKTADMVDVKSKRCETAGCGKQPTYNIEGSLVARYCATHKTADMVDVMNRRCETAGCGKRPTYGSLGQLPSHCATHKSKGMILRPRAHCSSAGCAALGTHEAAGRFCDDHAPADARNLGLFPCAACTLPGILVGGLCIDTCAPIATKYRAAKELRIRSLFAQAGHSDAALVANPEAASDTTPAAIPEETPKTTDPADFVHNKTLEGKQCGMERPDFLFDCGTHLVIVEVDENQHSGRACECEQARMVNLAEVRGMPVTFIRYNPDNYDPAVGQTVASDPQRHTQLLKWLAWARAMSPAERGDVVSVLYLYYDGHDTQAPALCSLVRVAAPSTPM